jgi:large-conductance mechanosensitive channel
MDGGGMSSRRLLLTIAVAFVIGSALTDFFASITEGLFTPILVSVFPSVQQTIYGQILQLGPVKLNVGKAISSTITLLVAMFVVSVTLPYIKAYAPIKGAGRS